MLEIKKILDGIDKDECQYDGGWWPTSTGRKFGAEKLAEIVAYVSRLQQELAEAQAERDEHKHFRANCQQLAEIGERRIKHLEAREKRLRETLIALLACRPLHSKDNAALNQACFDADRAISGEEDE